MKEVELDLVELLNLIELNDTLIIQQEQEVLMHAEKKLAEATGPRNRSRRRRFVRGIAKLAREMEDTELKIARLKAQL
jgi:hypothetical protein